MASFFSEATFNFLGQLAENNRREWFQEHKQQYEDAVREPALAFIKAMRPYMAEMAPHFVADARKMGGSLMRVHRDTRFSKDKTPYKTNIGIQFRHELG
ncbi:MAG TPA: TIGR02453 family protein, partial [Mariprofundaceae bacterium]|nr:TIGR02453 family protein [Mariprofundaceae bacterium]